MNFKKHIYLNEILALTECVRKRERVFEQNTGSLNAIAVKCDCYSIIYTSTQVQTVCYYACLITAKSLD